MPLRLFVAGGLERLSKVHVNDTKGYTAKAEQELIKTRRLMLQAAVLLDSTLEARVGNGCAACRFSSSLLGPQLDSAEHSAEHSAAICL